MNRGVLERSPVQHLPAAGNPNWWSNLNGGLRPPPPPPPQLPPPATSCLPPSLLPPSSNPNLSSCNWLETTDLPLDQPWSLSQLLLGGLMMGEEERMEMMNQEKKLQNREEEVPRHQASMKQESDNTNGYVIIPSLNSLPNKSCLTIHNNNQNGANLSECNTNSSEIGGSTYANKKPKLQLPSTQSTLKVRKEKLGGRIAALHQIVSPFGKTDTASVLSEAIGYIRFLHSQIEALSLPYFDTPTRNNMMHQHLVNEYCMKISNEASSSSTNNQEANPKEEIKKDLRSRGLCLVPISCTLQVGSDNGADYWAPAFGITFR